MLVRKNYVPYKNFLPPQNTEIPSVTLPFNVLKTKINQSYITRVSLCIRADRVFSIKESRINECYAGK